MRALTEELSDSFAIMKEFLQKYVTPPFVESFLNAVILPITRSTKTSVIKFNHGIGLVNWKSLGR